MNDEADVRLRHRIEYAVMRLGLGLLDGLSLPTAERWARRVGDFWFAVDRRRRRVACDNILRSGIAGTPEQASRIVRASFGHFATVIVESLKAREYLACDPPHVRVVNEISPAMMAILKAPQPGVIAVSGHLGNWEIAGQVMGRWKPVTAIVRNMNNPLTQRLMESRRLYGHTQLIPKHDTRMGQLRSVLRRGDALAILIDQHARGRGMMIDVFGIPASTHTTPAILHLLTGAPMCFGYCLRNGLMDFTLHIDGPFVHPRGDDREADVRAIMERMNRELETAIRLHPEQYLWAHRRWRLPPAA
jgi:KDO2-lipid IV(A) lauroyltransferase